MLGIIIRYVIVSGALTRYDTCRIILLCGLITICSLCIGRYYAEQFCFSWSRIGAIEIVYKQLSRNVSTAYHVTAVILTRSSRMNARQSIRNTVAVSILLFPT